MIKYLRPVVVLLLLGPAQRAIAAESISNDLRQSTSLFISHQAGSPVHWREWNDSSLSRAKTTQTPLFVVAGFSHCRRCETAFGEVFNTPELSTLINESFVPVLIDGDALPDVFSHLFKIAQSVAGATASPQAIILAPDLKPIWAAADPGKSELLRNLMTIQRSWSSDQRKDLLRTSEQFQKKLLQQHRPAKKKELPVETQLLRSFFREMAIKFDRELGGFHSISRSLPAMQILALNRIYRRTEKPEALEMINKTLHEIHAGGVHDQVDGGFFRQAGERGWAPDTFAKLLSDNALVTNAFLEAWKITSDPTYSTLTLKTLRFIVEQMRHKSGGFISAVLDRSPIAEQSSYTWNYSDLKTSLNPAQFKLLSKVFINENQPSSTMRADSVASTSIPLVLHSNATIFPKFGTPEHKELNQILIKLKALRKQRGPAKFDQSIHVGWNGLMIDTLCRAGKTFAQNDLIKHALDAATKIKRTAWNGGDLSHMIVNEKAVGFGTLEDYSMVIHGLLALTEATGQMEWLQLASNLQARQIELFWSEELSAFFDFQKSVTDEGLRGISLNDSTVPSGNNISVHNLIRLGNLSGKVDWKSIAERLLKSISSKILAHPSWYPYSMIGIDSFTDIFKELVIVAPRAKDLELEQAVFTTHFSPYAPNQVMLFRFGGQSLAPDSVAKELLNAKNPIKGKTTFYVCQNRTCKLPTTDVKKALELLGTKISYKVGKD